MFNIPQYTIENRNVQISVLNGVLWDMAQVHCGICESGQLCFFKGAHMVTIYRLHCHHELHILKRDMRDIIMLKTPLQYIVFVFTHSNVQHSWIENTTTSLNVRIVVEQNRNMVPGWLYYVCFFLEDISIVSIVYFYMLVAWRSKRLILTLWDAFSINCLVQSLTNLYLISNFCSFCMLMTLLYLPNLVRCYKWK